MSVCRHVFAAGGDVSFVEITAGLHWPIRAGKRKCPLSLQKRLTEKGPIVLNGRKEAFMDEAFGSGGAAPLW